MERVKLPNMYELCLMHARADRAMRVVVSDQLASQDLTLMEWLALNIICNGPKQGTSMSSIAHVLDVTLPQVTALITALTTRKLAKQIVLATDRRGRQVIPTVRGRRAIDKLESQVAEAMRVWSNDIPRDELQHYISAVRKFSEKA